MNINKINIFFNFFLKLIVIPSDPSYSVKKLKINHFFMIVNKMINYRNE